MVNTKLGYTIVAAVAVLFSGTALAENLEVYGKAGFPGVGVGVGYGINSKVTVRGDFTTAGRISRDFDYRSFDYEAKFKGDKLNVNADYFPFENNAFRLTTGLGFGRTELTATGRSQGSSTQTFKIGGKTYSVDLTSNDTLDAKTRYPAVSPYFGIGWGHDVARKKAGNWGFTADLGFYAGKPKTSVSINSDLYEKLVNSQLSSQTADEARAELDSRIATETAKVKDKVEKLKVIPVVNVGFTYNF